MKKSIQILPAVMMLLMTVTTVYAQFPQDITGRNIVCKNDALEYTFSFLGTTPGCSAHWSVVGGVFPDNNNQTFADVAANNGTSKAKIKWTTASGGRIDLVSVGCVGASPANSFSVTIDEIPLTVSANSEWLSDPGALVTLTASSPITNDFSWISSTANNIAHLNASSGSQVTANPILTTIFTATATRTFDHITQTITCRQAASVTVNVPITGIQGNSVCCGQCIVKGATPAQLNQTTGTTLSGGNGTPLNKSWQQSVNGGPFQTISGATGESFQPGAINETTAFRRVVGTQGISSPSISNVVVISVANVISGPIGATTYTQNTVKKANGTMEVSGDQIVSSDVQVELISNTSIHVSAPARLTAGLHLSIQDLCNIPNGRMAFAESKATPVIESPKIEEDTISGTVARSIIREKGLLKITPNPAIQSAKAAYTVPEPGVVSLKLVGPSGTVIKVLVDRQKLGSGEYSTALPVNDLTPGIYMCIYETGTQREVQRIFINPTDH